MSFHTFLSRCLQHNHLNVESQAFKRIIVSFPIKWV